MFFRCFPRPDRLLIIGPRVRVPEGAPFRHTKKERLSTLLFACFFAFSGCFGHFSLKKSFSYCSTYGRDGTCSPALFSPLFGFFKKYFLSGLFEVVVYTKALSAFRRERFAYFSTRNLIVLKLSFLETGFFLSSSLRSSRAAATPAVTAARETAEMSTAAASAYA